LVQAHPQPEFCQSIPLPKEIQGFWQSLTTNSQKFNECQPVEAEFHQFSRLPLELREKIWWFALPAQRPLEINIRINDKRKDISVWAVGPFAMLQVCEQSRRIALSLFKPRLELYTSREKPEQVLCARPNTLSRPEGHVFIYMRKGHTPIDIQPDSEVHSVVAWEDIPLGFMRMQVASPQFVSIKCFWNWPPEEDEEPIIVTFQKDHYERHKAMLLPPRLQHLSLGSSIHRMRGRRR
jgi:hypothetical protein